MAFYRIPVLSLIVAATPGVAETEADDWRAGGNVGMTLAAGNSDSLRATAGLEVTRTLGKWEMQASLAANYGTDDGRSSSERVEADFQINRDLGGRFYTGFSPEFLHDPPAGIDWRLVVTPLLGWRAIEGEKFKLRLEAGPGFTWQDGSRRGGGFSSLRLHGNSSYQFAGNIRLFQSLTTLFSVEEPDQFTINAEAGVESRLSGLWSLRVTAKAVYYGEAQASQDQDLLLTAGFGYNHLPTELERDSLESALGKVKFKAGQWRISGLLGGSLSRGNSEAVAVQAGLELKRKTPDNELAAGFFGSFGETGGKTSSGSLSVDTHFQREQGNGWFVGIRGDIDHDALADLPWRFALTPFGGWHLLKNKRTQVSLEAGPSAVMEEQGESEDSYLAGYLAAKVEHRIGEKSRLFGDLSWLSEASDWASFLLSSEVGIDHALSDKVSLKLIARNAFDSSPAPGRERHDFQLISALGVSF